MRNSSTVCVDANLVFKLVTGSTEHEVIDIWAAWRRYGTQFVAPAILLYEVPNAIHQANRFGSITSAEADTAIRTIIAMPIRYELNLADHESASRFARQFTLKATYDAHYLALADRIGIEYWTTDKKLVNAVRPALSWVRLVGESPGST